MGIEERLLIGDVLLRELHALASGLSRFNEDVPKIANKAIAIRRQMYMCYRVWGEPPKLLEQLKEMDEIIKKIEELHNKHV